MQKRILSTCIFLTLLGGGELYAQKTRHVVSNGNPTIKEATSRATLPGRQETERITEYRFVMVWNSTVAPTSMFWRPDRREWMDVTIARPERSPMFPGSPDYRTLEKRIKPGDIKKGDNIIITSRHSHGEHVMPAAVRPMPVQALYYQTKGGGWNVIKINKLAKQPDLVLP